MKQERIVICIMDRAFTNDPDKGLVKVLFEKFDDEFHLINQKEPFCNTEQVFIIRGYEELTEKYGDSIFQLSCTPTKNDVKDGDCQYVSAFEHSSPLRSKLSIAEIFSEKLPSVLNPYIITDSIPLSSVIFFENQDILTGPFIVKSVDETEMSTYKVNIETQSIELLSEDRKTFLPSNYFSKIKTVDAELQLKSFKLGDSNKKLVCDVKRLLNHSIDTEDFITDEQLISKYGQMIASNPQIRNFTKGMIGLIKNQVIQTKDFKINKVRFERFFKLLGFAGEDGEWGRIRGSLMEEFINSSQGEGILKQYIDENKVEYFKDEKKKIIVEIESELQEFKTELSELESSKFKIEGEIRQKKKELQNFDSGNYQAQVTEENHKVIDKDIEAKKLELTQLEEKFNVIKEKYSVYSSVEEAKKSRLDLDAYKSVISQDIKDLTAQKEKLAEDAKKGNAFYKQQLLAVKNEVDVLTGSGIPKEIQSTNFNVAAKFNLSSLNGKAQEEYIAQLSDNLGDLGRKTDFSQLANVVVTLAQSQFTLFSGFPGTGKTSLAKLLGKSMGLGNRLLNIPVARGWTSSRDILGFYNALSQSFVPSTTGLYHMLEQMQDEKLEQQSAPAIVLLDEFNLSQPEHYFSPFMEMADIESDRKIYTGDPSKPELRVPEHLRFLGTVNHDDSVQILTPRLLDRAAIIHFDDLIQESSLVTVLEKAKDIGSNKTISGQDFIKLFSAPSYSLPENINQIILNIVAVLHDDDPKLGNQVIVSYRKRKAINAYHSVASSLLIERSLYALDFAICQHIIPLLNGYGEQFGRRLNKLLEIIPDELEMTTKRISRIITKGELNLYSYGAFV
jgi:hypothetical protein